MLNILRVRSAFREICNAASRKGGLSLQRRRSLSCGTAQHFSVVAAAFVTYLKRLKAETPC